MAEPDIRIVFGADMANSAPKIRADFQNYFKNNPIKISFEIDKSSLQGVKKAQGELLKHTQSAEKSSNNFELGIIKAREADMNAAKKAATELNNFEAYISRLSGKGLSKYSAEIDNIRQALADVSEGGAGASHTLKDVRRDISGFKSTMRSEGLEAGNVFSTLNDKLVSFATYLASSAITMGVISFFRNTKNAVIDLNKALTDLRMVTGDTATGGQKMISAYNQIAKNLGSTTVTVSQAGVEWLRQGFTEDETNQLIEYSTILSKVGFMDSADAATALTAAMKGYKLEIEDVMSVVDKFTQLDMIAATSAGNIATALSKTATNAKLAGLALDDVAAHLTVVNEVMQEDPESTGTFYNTMLSRMGRVKSGMLDDPETGESLSDVETVLSGLGIKLRDSESEFRNFGEVLDEVGGKWDDFSSVQQRAVATAFAGTRQQTRFIALMDNWGTATKYSEVAMNSAGSAMQKFGAYQEGLEFKSNRMTASFEALANSLLSSDLVGGFYDLGAGVANFMSIGDALPAKILVITTALTSLSAVFKTLKASTLGKSFAATFEDLGWPKTTGDRIYNIVPIYIEEAA